MRQLAFPGEEPESVKPPEAVAEVILQRLSADAKTGELRPRRGLTAPSRASRKTGRTSLPSAEGVSSRSFRGGDSNGLDDRTDSGAVQSGSCAHARRSRNCASCAELDDPESVVVPILIDALLMVESYRGARHQISFLPELTESVDALLREVTIVEKSKEWTKP